MKDYHFYLKPGYETKTGDVPVYIRYYYNRGKRILIPTEVKVKKTEWNFKNNTLKPSAENYETKKERLYYANARFSQIIEHAYRNEIEPTPRFVRTELFKQTTKKKTKNEKEILKEFDNFVEDKKQEVSLDTIRQYGTLKSHLKEFNKIYKKKYGTNIEFSSIDYSFYNDFKSFLLYEYVRKDKIKGIKPNSVGNSIKNLKAFLNDRAKHKIIEKPDLTDFKKINVPSNKIYLTEKELLKLYEHDFSEKPHLENIRDAFIVGCYTGLRHSDLRKLNKDMVDTDTGLIIITPQKVNNGKIYIPLLGLAKEILAKNDYNLTVCHINRFNKHIKTVLKEAKINKTEIHEYRHGNEVKTEENKKYELVSSHTMRRSFCTNLYLMGFEAEEIMKMSGHTTVGALLTYIKVDEYMNALRVKAKMEKINANKILNN